MRVGITSVRGAPGVSVLTAALACAATGPVLAIEADPCGSVVTPRWGWSDSIHDVTRLATASPNADPWQRARRWVGSSRVIVGGSHPMSMANPAVGAWLTRTLPRLRGPTIVDLGRLRTGTHQLDVASALDEVWLVVDRDVAALSSLRTWMPTLVAKELHCRLFVRDRVPWADNEVAETLGLAVSGRIPTDDPAAAALSGRGGLSERLVRRSALVRACATWSTWISPAEVAG